MPLLAAVVPLVARPCRLLRWRSGPARSGWRAALSANAMLRIHGDRNSLLAALAAHWVDQQLQIAPPLKLRLAEVLELHRRLIEQTGGMPGLRDLGLLESSIAQPHQSFGGVDLYPGLNAKAAALGFSLIQNHPIAANAAG